MIEPPAASEVPGGRQAEDGGVVQPGRMSIAGLQQADILKTEQIPCLGPAGEAAWWPTPDGVVIISQTCDVVRDTKEYLQVAPLVRLTGNTARQAAKGAMPGYVLVPEADAFADLDHVATVSKQHLAMLVPQRGVASTQDLRLFGMRVGRRFSRFAFPDAVSEWLQPLKGLVIDKAGRATSALGRVLDEQVESLRLECSPSWDEGAPYELTLLVVVKPGLLPVLDEKQPAPSASPNLSRWLWDAEGALLRKPVVIAEKIDTVTPSTSVGDRLWLWECFAESLAATCRPPASAPPEIADAVNGREISAEVATAREVVYERILRSEEIDLEHLSPPLPR
ncbi:hypothetical protein ABT237_07520 [Streptomyces sp. NPDC001581]|uniref:hypothetical protein n=1 Tax=Streptomyces sp. NPDC001581 TaxID=3154386 RepID=UPI00332E33E4